VSFCWKKASVEWIGNGIAGRFLDGKESSSEIQKDLRRNSDSKLETKPSLEIESWPQMFLPKIIEVLLEGSSAVEECP